MAGGRKRLRTKASIYVDLEAREDGDDSETEEQCFEEGTYAGCDFMTMYERITSTDGFIVDEVSEDEAMSYDGPGMQIESHIDDFDSLVNKLPNESVAAPESLTENPPHSEGVLVCARTLGSTAQHDFGMFLLPTKVG